jgi:cyanophycinase
MAGEFALVGGEEFRSGCEDMDREIIRASGLDPCRVVVIPTAAVTGPDRAAQNGVAYFSRLGADAQPLMVLERSQAQDPEAARSIADAGIIYFTGGSPDHLRTTLQGSALLEAILSAVERGAVLAGSSAGAMVMGSLMRRPRLGQWVEALGLAPNLAVLPHHENSDPAATVATLQGQVPPELTVLGIDARSGCLGRPGNWRVVGPGRVTVYRDGQWQVYQSGQQLPADV